MSRNQHQLEYDHMGSFGSNALFKELASDPSAPAAGLETLFVRPTGLYLRNSGGTITGPMGPTGSAAGAFGSNANDVGNPSTGGANSSNSRADHVHLGIRSVAANSSNNLTQPNIGLVSGSGIAFAVSASTLTISALGSGGGGGSVSYGSNATDVSSVSAVGGSSNVAREDHVHKGVHQITSNTSNAKVGDVNLQAGSGIALGVSAQNITITNTGASSGGGGGSGVTVQYPALKPATPTYDFATASLPGAFSAHSSGGTFVIGNVTPQGVDWVGSSVELEFSEQFGGIYVSHADTDLDFQVGGINVYGLSAVPVMVGIAGLNSSGTGVGVMAYTDGNGYIATVTTWDYGGFSDSWSNHGLGAPTSTGTSTNQGYWMRLKRVSGTWTGYMSQSGRAWDKVFATRADSITVDRLFFGMIFDNSGLYSGRLTADYFDVAV